MVRKRYVIVSIDPDGVQYQHPFRYRTKGQCIAAAERLAAAVPTLQWCWRQL